VLKPTAFAAKPVAKAEPKYAPPPLPQLDAEDDDDDDDGDDDDEQQAVMLPPARPREKEAERRPPPPVLPSLGKGAKAKKKKYRE